MNLTLNWLVFLIGLFWGTWGLVAKASDIKDPFVRGFIVSAVTAMGFVPFLPGRTSLATAASFGSIILMVAGLSNFAGHLLFAKTQTTTGSQISIYMTLIPALVLVISNAGGSIFYQEPVTAPKMLFTLLILIGIVGLAFTS